LADLNRAEPEETQREAHPVVKYAFLCGGSVIAVAASLYGTQALAATANAADTASSVGTVGELVVTAGKREAKIESVPVAITAYSSEQRKLMGIEIVQDLANFTPSLVWTDINDRIFIRGIGRNSDNLNNTSGVAIYYNGLYYGANASVEEQKDDLFIGNIEVDAGPQNTLHGSNSDGGVINFVSQRPTDSLYAEGRFGFQNLQEEFAEGVVSGPINDHLKFRFGGNFTIERGGNFLNYDGPPQGGGLVLGGGGNTEYLEFQLQGHWDHFDTWTQVSGADFAANSKGTDALGNIPTNLILNGGLVPSGFFGLCALPGVTAANAAGCASGPPAIGATTLPVTANRFPGNNPGNVNPRTFIQEFNSINNQQRNIQVSEDATWHAPDFDIQYLGSYQQFHYILEFPTATDAGVTSFTVPGSANVPTCAFLTGNAAGCAAPLTIFPAPNFTLFNEYDQSFSHEINVISTWQNPLQYVGGLYWWHEHWNQPVDAGVEPAQAQLANPQFFEPLAAIGNTGCAPPAELCTAPFNPSSAASTENTEINYNSYAVYGQVSYKFNDNWKVSGALRYTDDDKKGWQEWRLVVFDGGVLGPGVGSGLFGSLTPGIDITRLATLASLGRSFPGAGPASINPVTGFAQRTLHLNNGAVTGEFDIDWTPDPSLLVYGKYSRGYKSGGWSTYTLGANPETQPEFVDAFEAGAKKSTGQYTINADVFYYNYYNEQTPLTIQDPTTHQLIPLLFNIPLVHDYGFELSSNWRATDDLIFNLTYSYLSATVATSPCVEDTTDPLALSPGANTTGCVAGSPAAQNIKGQTVPSATPNKVSFNTLYTFHFEPGNLTLSGTLVWKDGTYYSVFNRPYNFAPNYAVLNLRAVWADAKDRYNIILFMNNVSNALGYDGSAGTLLLGETVGLKPNILTTQALIAPREYGIQFQFRFK
jgi:iron complex outermembrane receptor protein